MKKKLLLSVLAAGLVLPTASALAETKVEPKPKAIVNEKGEFEGAVPSTAPTVEEKATAELKTEKGEAATKTPLKAIIGKDGQFEGAVPAYNLTTEAKPEAKPEMDKKEEAKKPTSKKGNKVVGKTVSKAANKAGMKKLPKTSAVK